tara:strand:- start:50 stop:289 length:240 start_codon:yes stop_codon:yes gene_type:complete
MKRLIGVLLVLVTGCGTKQGWGFTALEKLGASIQRNENGIGVSLFDPQITDDGLVHLKDLTDLRLFTPWRNSSRSSVWG